MRGIIVGLLFVALAAIFGIVYAESERVAREQFVSADDTNYEYALAVSLQDAGNIISYNLHYTSEQCERAKKYAKQQSWAIKAACMPLPKQKVEDHH